MLFPCQVLLLNGSHDRETSGFSASCFVTAITDALNRTYGNPHNSLKNLVSKKMLFRFLNVLLLLYVIINSFNIIIGDNSCYEHYLCSRINKFLNFLEHFRLILFGSKVSCFISPLNLVGENLCNIKHYLIVSDAIFGV